MQDLLMLWDAIFSDGISFDLVDYVFVAMLLYIKDASQWPSLSCFTHGACIRGFYRVSRYVLVFFFLSAGYVNVRRSRCYEDLTSFFCGQLEETTGTSSYNVVEDYYSTFMHSVSKNDPSFSCFE